MASLKSLAKDTVIYGLSSIVGRFLNYLLVPLYTAKISAASGGYGVITNMYSYTALLLVLLTFGMETTFFRFATKKGENPCKVYSTILTTVGCVNILFVIAVNMFLLPVSTVMGYPDHPEYIAIMAVVVAIDAFQAIPFAFLRQNNKAIKFASLKLLFIALNISLNLLYFVVLPKVYKIYPQVVDAIYNPAVGAGYAFSINLVCTAFITLFLIPELRKARLSIDRKLLRRMLAYSWPILVLGIAGILNQTADKIMFLKIFNGTQEEARTQLGIYGAASKIAMIMAMITQAFRYAYEPFVFSGARAKDSRETYAKAMRYFIIFTLLAFLAVMAFIDVLKYIIGEDYWDGLVVVPIVMVAEIMMGIYFNLSFWYKLTDRTIWGAYFSGIGCAILIAINVIFVPVYGFMACAWAGVAGYGTAMVLSYFVGQRYYPIKYPLKAIAAYTLVAACIYGAYCGLDACAVSITAHTSPLMAQVISVVVKALLLVAFSAVVVYREILLPRRHP